VQQLPMIVRWVPVELLLEQVEHPKIDGLPQLGDPLRVPISGVKTARFEGSIRGGDS